MGCGCSKKNPPNPEEQAAQKSAQAESRAQAAARFREERQQRILAQRRHVDSVTAQISLPDVNSGA